MEKYKKMAITRHGDQQYYLSKILSEKYLSTFPNPEYTKQDEIEKCRILEIPNTNTCFITGTSCNGVGDHVYEVNGYHRYTQKEELMTNGILYLYAVHQIKYIKKLNSLCQTVHW